MPKKLKVNYMDHWNQRDGNVPWEELGYSDYLPHGSRITISQQESESLSAAP